jgi:hypothetical protein
MQARKRAPGKPAWPHIRCSTQETYLQSKGILVLLVGKPLQLHAGVLEEASGAAHGITKAALHLAEPGLRGQLQLLDDAGIPLLPGSTLPQPANDGAKSSRTDSFASQKQGRMFVVRLSGQYKMPAMR